MEFRANITNIPTDPQKIFENVWIRLSLTVKKDQSNDVRTTPKDIAMQISNWLVFSGQSIAIGNRKKWNKFHTQGRQIKSKQKVKILLLAPFSINHFSISICPLPAAKNDKSPSYMVL